MWRNFACSLKNKDVGYCGKLFRVRGSLLAERKRENNPPHSRKLPAVTHTIWNPDLSGFQIPTVFGCQYIKHFLRWAFKGWFYLIFRSNKIICSGTGQASVTSPHPRATLPSSLGSKRTRYKTQISSGSRLKFFMSDIEAFTGNI